MSEEWKILKQETIGVENNGFIEVSLKEHPSKEEVLIGLSKGWIKKDGKKLYKSNILFSKEKKEELIKILKNIDN